MEERVQKIMASAGLGSRRACEKLIESGHVKVNGKVIHLGDKADPSKDTITVDGKLLRVSAERIYIALNKPKGYLSDIDENHPRPTVNDLIGISEPLFAVGRLDLDSEGLILMTNDGVLANRLTHPRYHHEKEYEVMVIKTLTRNSWKFGGAVWCWRTAPAHCPRRWRSWAVTAMVPGCGSSCTKARSARSARWVRALACLFHRSNVCA